MRQGPNVWQFGNNGLHGQGLPRRQMVMRPHRIEIDVIRAEMTASVRGLLHFEFPTQLRTS